MRWLFVLAVASGCAASSTPAAPEAPRPAAPDDAAAITAVHEFFEAVDQRDATKLRERTTAGFFLFEDGRALPTEELAGFYKDSTRPPRTRECGDEKVRRSDGALIYVGDCKESQPASSDRPAETFEGYNTVVLVSDGDRWKVALWQWQRSGLEAERIRWNDAYRRDTWYTKKPNRLLVEIAASVEKPGAALVLAMGQGRNALHLAGNGWKVTGLDISEIGVTRARAAAAERGLELDAVIADINAYDFGEGKWDMVTMLYAGGDPDWIARAKKSLRPGGVFVFEHFLKLGGKGGPDSKKKLVARFAGWEILRDEIVEDTADWGMRKAKLVRLVARKPR